MRNLFVIPALFLAFISSSFISKPVVNQKKLCSPYAIFQNASTTVTVTEFKLVGLTNGAVFSETSIAPGTSRNMNGGGAIGAQSFDVSITLPSHGASRIRIYDGSGLLVACYDIPSSRSSSTTYTTTLTPYGCANTFTLIFEEGSC